MKELKSMKGERPLRGGERIGTSFPMAPRSLATLPLWKRFARTARARRRDPLRLLSTYMRERLEAWEDQALDAAIRADLRHSAHSERDAVAIVRRYRSEPRARRAAS